MASSDMDKLLANFNGNPPVPATSIQQFESCITGLCLTESYSGFLQTADGGEGFIGSTYIILWRLGELVEMNKAYEASEYAPGLFLFGSDGGGEAFAFDLRSDTKPVVAIPFVGMDLELIRPLASTFGEFLEELAGA